MRWRIMAAVCGSCFWLMCQNALLMPGNVIVAHEETTLWGVLEGVRNYDVALSLAWEGQDENLSPMERGEAWTYVWEYELGDDVILCSDYAQGLVRPVADSWHLFDCQQFELSDGKDLGVVEVRLRYWDGLGEAHCVNRRMTVVRKAGWGSREEIDLRRRLGVMHGLHYLQCHQNEAGGWQEGADDWYWIATTACAVWAFGNHGFGVGNKKDNPFLSCVEQGVKYLMKVCNVCHLTDANHGDVNCNGRAIRLGESWKYSNYVHPICVCGLIAAGSPEYEVTIDGGGTEQKEALPLRDVVEDGVDYILMQLKASGRNSWAYDFNEGGDGYDLSIAGWNYMALLAGGQWGVEIGRDVRLKFRSFLESVYFRSMNCFIYNPKTPGSHTESLDASGVIGLLLMSGHGLLDDELQCFDEHHGIGEAVVDGTLQLFNWVRTAPGRNVGYSWWSVAKGLGMAGVTGVVFNGMEFDWRYGGFEDGRQMTGGWRKILEGQEPDGRWTIDEDMYYYGLTRVDWRQTCMETSMMVLALSDDILPSVKSSLQTVDVVLQVPGKVYAGMVEKHSGDEQPDGSVMLEWSRNGMDDGEEWDLSFDYWLGDADEEGDELVQIGGSVSWKNHAGQDVVISLEELVVERNGNGYRMELQTAGCYERGDGMLIDVELVLPKGDVSHVVQFSDGTDEAVVWESANAVTWLGVEFLGDLQPKQMDFFHLPDVRMRNWVADVLNFSSMEEAVFAEDTRGQCLKAVARDSFMQGTVVVYGNEEPIYAAVFLEHRETGKVYEVEQWEISPSAFGGAESVGLYFDSEGILPGMYTCSGKIWKEGRILAKAECPVEISMQKVLKDWLQEQATEVVAELEFEVFENDESHEDSESHENDENHEDSGNHENHEDSESHESDESHDKPMEPEPIYPIEPVYPVDPEISGGHGVFFMKQPINREREYDEGENIFPEKIKKDSDVEQGVVPNNEKQSMAMIQDYGKKDIIVPGSWANLDAMKHLGLRWGRIVTKSGPYPWEYGLRKLKNGKDSMLQNKPMPVFCERCEKYWQLYGLIMKPEKGCCIYGMLNAGGWLLK